MPAAFDLSSLDGTNGFRLNGPSVASGAGFSVSDAGDVNGDGFDDLIIGAYKVNGYAGASYVVFGSGTGFDPTLSLASLNGTNGFRLNGEVGFDRSGRSVSGAGDINGDGFDDLIVGAAFADPNSTADAGASYVVFGKASGFAGSINLSGLNGTNGFQINGAGAGHFSGISVSGAGDINDDGFADVIIGAYRETANGSYSGASYVLFGTNTAFGANVDLSGLTGANGFRIAGVAASDNAGWSVSAAGDVNGDGIDDVLIGARLALSNTGVSYVVYGKTGGFSANLNLSALDGSNGFRLVGATGQDYSGSSVSNAGDVNGDGFDDLIIGAYGFDGTGSNSGASYVVFGKADSFGASLDLSALDGSTGFRILGAASSDRSGKAVSNAGDLNGDGYDDLLIGADFATMKDQTNPLFTERSGAAYVVYGKASGFAASLNLTDLTGSNGFLIEGLSHVDYAGRSVSSAGDVNGDGFDDLIIGADGTDLDGINVSGGAYVIFGAATAIDGTTGADTLTGSARADTINGLDGNDSITGGLGDDTIYGDGGNDTIDGGAGTDVMYGGAGADVFILDSENDTLFDDSGIDEVRATFSISLALAAFDAIENAGLLGSGNVNLTGDSAANALTGNSGRNTLTGAAGNDTIAGGGGNDTITGGAGRDVLTGGAGNDVFKFLALADMTTSTSTTDVIMDFKRGQDKIDLSTMDASTKISGNNKFTFDAKIAHSTSKEGDIYYKQFNNAGTSNDYTLVYIDTDSDISSEAVIKVMNLHSFTASDFIL